MTEVRIGIGSDCLTHDRKLDKVDSPVDNRIFLIYIYICGR